MLPKPKTRIGGNPRFRGQTKRPASARSALRARGNGQSRLVHKLKRRLWALQAENRALRAARSSPAVETDFRQVIDASPVPLSVDDMKGNIEYLNRKFVEKFGYTRAELPTSAAWFARAYPDPEYRRQVATQWQACLKRGLRTGKEIGPLEVEVTCKDGSLRRVEFVGTVVGRRFLLAANDLTERERLEQQILEISDQERERIGQDLHDGLCQLLSGIKYKITLLEQKLDAKNAAEAKDAGAIERLINSAIHQARNVARGLHPVDLEARGLMSALEGLAAGVSSVFGVSCVCQFKKPVLVHDHAMATHLYRIAQEATTNAIRHGHATKIWIRLTCSDNFLKLCVQDNGCGLPPKPKRKAGMGLHLMNYRARTVGAHLEVQPGPTEGTVVKCWLRGPNLSNANRRLL
mgnify:FL=1